MYCFYQDISDSEKREYWYLNSMPLLCSKKLSYDDFESIKVGSSIYDVYEVDSVVSKYVKIDNSYPYKFYDSDSKEVKESIEKHGHRVREIKNIAPFQSYHLLVDGLLTITYEYKNDGFIVSDINFNKDYKMYDLHSKEVVSRRVTEADLPQD